MNYLVFLLISMAVYGVFSFGFYLVPGVNQLDWEIFYGVFFFANIADYHSTLIGVKKYGVNIEGNPFARVYLRRRKIFFFIKLCVTPLFLWWLLSVSPPSSSAAIALIFIFIAINNYLVVYKKGRDK